MSNIIDDYSRVLEGALALPSLDKAALIEKLFESFGDVDRATLDAEWGEESERRLGGFEKGQIKAFPEDDVFRDL
jgi:putative addiction module component (TIGR02574 family)